MIREVRFFLNEHAPELPELVRDLPGLYPGVKLKNDQLLIAPVNAAWLVEQALDRNKIQYSIFKEKPPRQYTWESVESCPELILDEPYFAFQHRGVLRALNAPRESMSFQWPTGSGKTRGAITWGLINPGTFVFVCRGGARRTIEKDFVRFSHVKPFVMLPKSERTKKAHWAAWHEFEANLAQGIVPRAIVVGRESLPLFIDILLECKPVSLAIDEIHLHSSHKRWKAVRDADKPDEVKFVRMKNIASAMSRLAFRCRRRIGLTATAVADRPRNLWAQLDLVHPRAWGKYWDWAYRYADVTTNTWGGRDDKGKSNSDELRRRMVFCVDQVDYSVTHRDLPPMRRQVIWLDKTDQDPPSAFAEEWKRAHKLGMTHLREVRLAEAASRKRTYISDLAIEAARCGQKVVIFTGRHRDCERIDAYLKKALEKAGVSAPVWMAHGGHGISRRDSVREEYMASKTGILVGTSQAWGESVQLNETDIGIFAMLPINAKEIFQWEGRFVRHGSANPRSVLIYYPIAEGTYDERVHAILLDKLPAVEDLQKDSNFTEAYRALLGDPQVMEQKLLDAVLSEGDPDLVELEAE